MVSELPRQVIKVGGSLLNCPQTPARLRRWLAARGASRNILLAGGGQLVDQVRHWQRAGHLSEERAHWMSIECMSLTANLLQRWLDLPLIWHPDQLDSHPAPNLVVDVQLWLRHDEDMPVGWSVTSDSIAARLARRVDASELVLLKSGPVSAGTDSIASLIDDAYVDSQFGRYLQGVRSVGFVDFRNAWSDIVYLPTPPTPVSGNPA